jgi:hypothetical protein
MFFHLRSSQLKVFISKEQSVTLVKLFSMSAVEAVHGAVELAHQKPYILGPVDILVARGDILDVIVLKPIKGPSKSSCDTRITSWSTAPNLGSGRSFVTFTFGFLWRLYSQELQSYI